jgi:hypothetical protein
MNCFDAVFMISQYFLSHIAFSLEIALVRAFLVN